MAMLTGDYKPLAGVWAYGHPRGLGYCQHPALATAEVAAAGRGDAAGLRKRRGSLTSQRGLRPVGALTRQIYTEQTLSGAGPLGFRASSLGIDGNHRRQACLFWIFSREISRMSLLRTHERC